MEIPIEKYFSSGDPVYSSILSAKADLSQIAQSGNKSYAIDVAKHLASLRARISQDPQNFSIYDAQIKETIAQIADRRKSLPDDKKDSGYGPLKYDETNGRMYQESLANPNARKYISPQMGFRVTTGPDGSQIFEQVPVTGNKGKPAESPEKLSDMDFTNSIDMVSLFDDALKEFSEIPQGKGFSGAAMRFVDQFIPGSQTKDFLSVRKALEGKALLTKLVQLKQSSANGSTGFGQFSNQEGEFAIADVLGAINDITVSDPEIIRRALERGKKKLLDLNYGSKKYRLKLLEQGKISGELFDKIESLYDGSYTSWSGGQNETADNATPLPATPSATPSAPAQNPTESPEYNDAMEYYRQMKASRQQR